MKGNVHKSLVTLYIINYSKEGKVEYMEKIAFGTGGLRGIMGNEPGNINYRVIQRVTHGLTNVIM